MIEIDRFYDHEELTEKLETLSTARIVELESIGESLEGRELWCASVAGAEGRADPGDRPALLVTANMHAREYAGSWTALRLLDRLVEGYGTDDELTDLLDRRTVYVIPRVCPDGADFTLETRTKKCRSRFVEVDPEDVREPNTVLPGDVTGDGRILSMRWPTEDGGQVVPDDEPRLTLSRSDDDMEGPFYRQTVEGRVANHDGGPVSELSMRSDFNRNFPSEGWQPFDWIGHGPYPLSEPETRAVAEFVLDHPNVVTAVDLHTGNPAIFYSNGVKGDDIDHPADADLLRRLGEQGEELTGFPYIEGYYEMSDRDPYTLHGSFKDWVYDRVGVPGFIVEHGMLYNSLGFDTADLAMDSREHSRATGEALLAYQEEHPDRPVFHEWQPVEHPELGEVEVGGWDWATLGSPSPEDMPGIAADVSEWLIDLLEWAPDVHVDTEVEPVEDGLNRVVATVRNRGRVPTSVTQQGTSSIQDAAPVVSVDGGELVAGRPRQAIEHLDSNGASDRLEWVVRGGDEFVISVTAARGANADVSVSLDQ